MQKFASEFKTTNVVTKREKVIVGNLFDFVINPDSGFVIGIIIEIFDKKKTKKTVNVSQVVGIGADFVMIVSLDDLAEPDEIIRIKEVLDSDIKIRNTKVYNQNNDYLGKVKDYTLNFHTMSLNRLYIRPANMLKVILEDLVIPRNDIIKIEKNRIIVRSGAIKQKTTYPSSILKSKSVPRKTETA